MTTPKKPKHGGKRTPQMGRPLELGASTQKGIRFEDADIDAVDLERGSMAFAEWVRRAVKEKLAKEKGSAT